MAGSEDGISNILDDSEPTLDEGEEGEEVTAAEVLARLEQAWLNEKFAPELLECKSELVDCMHDQIKEMEENLKNVSKGDLVGSFHKLEVKSSNFKSLKVDIDQEKFSLAEISAQIQRIHYVISSYLKIRLQKIEQYAFDIMEATEEDDGVDYMSRLSADEEDYVKQYCKNVEDLFKSLALDHVPVNIKALDKKSVPQPNLDSYLFMKVLEPQDQVELDPDDQAIDLEKGAQHLVRYNVISSLLETDAVALI